MFSKECLKGGGNSPSGGNGKFCCQGDFLLGGVTLRRSDFDHLNLKSTFCKYWKSIKIKISVTCQWCIRVFLGRMTDTCIEPTKVQPFCWVEKSSNFVLPDALKMHSPVLVVLRFLYIMKHSFSWVTFKKFTLHPLSRENPVLRKNKQNLQNFADNEGTSHNLSFGFSVLYSLILSFFFLQLESSSKSWGFYRTLLNLSWYSAENYNSIYKFCQSKPTEVNKWVALFIFLLYGRQTWMTELILAISLLGVIFL